MDTVEGHETLGFAGGCGAINEISAQNSKKKLGATKNFVCFQHSGGKFASLKSSGISLVEGRACQPARFKNFRAYRANTKKKGKNGALWKES